MAKQRKTFTGLEQPKKTVADQPWPALPYLYECENGHQCGGAHPIEHCPNFVAGKPCTALLVRYGKGAGRGAHFKKPETKCVWCRRTEDDHADVTGHTFAVQCPSRHEKGRGPHASIACTREENHPGPHKNGTVTWGARVVRRPSRVD